MPWQPVLAPRAIDFIVHVDRAVAGTKLLLELLLRALAHPWRNLLNPHPPKSTRHEAHVWYSLFTVLSTHSTQYSQYSVLTVLSTQVLSARDEAEVG